MFPIPHVPPRQIAGWFQLETLASYPRPVPNAWNGMLIDVARRALAVSVRMRTPRWLSEYCRAGDHWSYDALVATPVFPSASNRNAISAPSALVPLVRIGSMFGSTG